VVNGENGPITAGGKQQAIVPTPDQTSYPPLTTHHSPLTLLHYRPWRGQFRSAGASVWPIARVALTLIVRRKLFWTLYALALLFFLMFFFGQYLLAWAESQIGEETTNVGLGVRVNPRWLIERLRDDLRINGTAQTYSVFFWYQGYMVMVVLALAGAILVGNDFHFGSLPFYLSKPLRPWHYVLGKCLAVAVFINLMTTLPAILLFVQYGLLTEWSYFFSHADLLAGIVGYGLVLTVSLSLLLLATASWLRRTVPLIMAWTTLFVFFRLLASALVDGLYYSPRWRLIDLWNDTYLVGNACLGNLPTSPYRLATQPAVHEAALVLGGVCLVCLSYLNLRIRAVEIVK
jgi:ABC-type transport system involved in multi-copper enzyme maturation permease subunit